MRIALRFKNATAMRPMGCRYGMGLSFWVGMLILLAAFPLPAQTTFNTPAYNFTTIVGQAGVGGSTDGTGAGALFNGPAAVAVDGSGNEYIVDGTDGTLRKVSATGTVTTLAGGFDDPRGVAVDATGNVYISEFNEGTVYKLNPAGDLSLLAGSRGNLGYANSTVGPNAQFDGPTGLAVDTGGNIYVADTFNHVIRMITSPGVVSTLAGTAGVSGSTDSPPLFNFPFGVAVDRSGNVFVADTYNHTIREIEPGGTVITLAGTAGNAGFYDGPAQSARFSYPNGLAVDGSGNIYVADTGASTMRLITSRAVTTLAGKPGTSGTSDGTAAQAQFSYPAGVAVDSSGRLYVADTGNNIVRRGIELSVPTIFSSATTYSFVTSAGQVRIPGLTNGMALPVNLGSNVFDVAPDGSGNIYFIVGDAVCELTLAGTLTTIAGSINTPGSSDGVGSAASFNYPLGLAVDSSDNIYVADSSNDIIRKIAPGGVVTTFAGTAGIEGAADGIGSAAGFNTPSGIAVSANGTLYVTDTNNCTIRQISPAGVVTTLAGNHAASGSADGNGAAAQFSASRGMAIDSNGNLFVADFGNSTIRKVTPGGVVTTLAGTAGVYGGADGTGPTAQFNSPEGVAVDANDNIYVADSFNCTIRKITSTGVVTTLAGTAGTSGLVNGTGANALFNDPFGIAVDGNGNVIVADTNNSAIREITPAGVVSTLPPFALFNNPSTVAVDGNRNIYIADSNNFTIRKMNPAGVVTTLAGMAGVPGSANGTGTAAQFVLPHSLAVDTIGNVYVADESDNTVRKITPTGVVTTLAGTSGVAGSADGTGTAAQFNFPSGIAVGDDGNIYVSDGGNGTIRKITPAGVVTTLAGTAGVAGSADGVGPAARFNSPNGVAVDGNGTVYVADSGNNTIREISPSGMVTTLAGAAGVSGSTDGMGTGARFSSPHGVAVDGTGNVYVVDSTNNTIREIASTGVVTTLAGQPGITGSSDGTGGEAQFNGADGIAVDGNGTLYVADAANDTIREGLPQIPLSFLSTISPVVGEQIALYTTDNSGFALYYAVLSGPATISGANGNIVTITGVGNITLGIVGPADVRIAIKQPGSPGVVPNEPLSSQPVSPEVGTTGAVTIQLLSQAIYAFNIIGTQTYGEAPFTVTLPTANDASGEPVTVTVQSGPATISGNTITITGAGTVVLAADQAANANYSSAGEVTTSFTVNQGSQTITFPVIGTQFLENFPLTLDATASSGLTVAYNVVSGPATLSGSGTLTLTGTGTVMIQASQGGTANYLAATSVTQSFAVTAAPATKIFSQWETQYPSLLITSPAATPENDGVANLLKYFYDIDPGRPMTSPDRAALPVFGMTTIGVTNYLTLSYRQYASLTDVTLHVQTSSDLKTWTTVTNPTIVQTGIDLNTGDPLMEVKIPAAGPKQFLRLNITSP